MKRSGTDKKDRRDEGLLVHIGYATGSGGFFGGDPAGRSHESYGEESVSGDTVLSCHLPGGGRAIILSDGMGRGAQAAAESRLAAEGLRRRLKRGMPVVKAMRQINRTLLEREAGAERFATVDLLVIDGEAGMARFYKMGAAPSYLLRDGQVRKVQRPALPVGILPYPTLRQAACRLAGGDIIVMMSDGICDAGWRRGEGDWVAAYLRRRPGLDGRGPAGPRQLAAQLFHEARRRSLACGGEEADDATVAVIVLEERR